MQNRPLYPIGVVADLIDVHPETIRVWEKNGLVQPARRSGKRFYSETDLKRLQFIKRLISQDLNLPAIRHYLQLYPCWQLNNCPGCMNRTDQASCAKPCWQEEGTYCQVNSSEDLCSTCQYRDQHVYSEASSNNSLVQ